MNRNKIIVLGITTIFLLIIATIGFAYGYYNSFIRKIEQSKKITVTSGTSEITYISSLSEDETIETIKPGFKKVDYFAVKNTGNTNAMYFIYLENVINSFIYKEDITYSLYKTKGLETINFDFIDIDTLDYTNWELIIDNETYPSNDSLLKDEKERINIKNEYYIYALVVNYKYRLDKDQSVDADHIFGGNIKLIPTDTINTENIFDKGTLAHEILNNSILNLNGTKYSETNIDNLINENTKVNLLSTTNDNYGMSYYFRGNVQDNYINFNNKCFKIIRIEGDGSIKIVLYDDKSTCNENLKNNNNPLLKNEEELIKKTYLDEIKIELNNWYKQNNFKSVEKYLKLNKWCIGNSNDKYNSLNNNKIENIDNYIKENTNEEGLYSYKYITKKRIEEKNPTLICNELDEVYESYIGLLNADEIVFNQNNGSIHSMENNIATFTLSQYSNNTNYIYTYDLKEIPITESFVINPSLTLISNINYKSGNGTINNPYEIK